MDQLAPEPHEGTQTKARQVLDDIVEECQRKRILIGTSNAREIIFKHVLLALAEKDNAPQVSGKTDS